MSEQISSPGGVSPQPPIPHIKQGGSSGGGSEGFAAMLGPSATPEQIHKAMMQAINFIIIDLKRAEKEAKKTAQHMKKVIEGKEGQ